MNTSILARELNVYGSRPYRDKESSIFRFGVTVQRPNHGICHYLIVGIMGVYICRLLRKYNLLDIKTSEDKILWIGAFQRTGRESEISSSGNPKLYKSYEKTCK